MYCIVFVFCSLTVNTCIYSSFPLLNESAHIVQHQPSALYHIQGDTSVLFSLLFFTHHNAICADNETNIVSFLNGAQIVVPICPSTHHCVPAEKPEPIGWVHLWRCNSSIVKSCLLTPSSTVAVLLWFHFYRKEYMIHSICKCPKHHMYYVRSMILHWWSLRINTVLESFRNDSIGIGTSSSAFPETLSHKPSHSSRLQASQSFW